MTDNKSSVDIDKPLREQCPALIEQEMTGVLIEPATTIRSICNELRKLSLRRCGFWHENWKWNPGKQPCPEAVRNYNAGCTHSIANGLFAQAELAAKALGKTEEGKALFDVFNALFVEVDDVDFHCRPLYQLSTDGSTSNFPEAERSLERLRELGIETDAAPGQSSEVCEHLCRFQDEHAAQILVLRDRFLALLGG